MHFIGYAGSFLVALSMLMNNIRRLRMINLLGAVAFAAYGWLIGAWPVFILNSFIVVVDLVYLVKLTRQKDAFSFFIAEPDSKFLREFLAFWADDIDRFFPGFDFETIKNPIPRLIMRNLNPVGIFVCEDAGDGVARVLIDYVVPGYRDFKNAYFLYTSSHPKLKADGFHTFDVTSTVRQHRRYLKRLGFKEDAKRPGHFTGKV
jgi:hypothetical protein